AGLDEPAGEQEALAPRRGAAAVGRLGVERRHEAVALAELRRLGVEVERVAGGLRREDAPRLLAEAVHRLDLAGAVRLAPHRVEALDQRAPAAEALHRDAGGQLEVGHAERAG